MITLEGQELGAPRARPREISRARVLARFDAAADACAVIVVTGRPGAGKSTAAAQWVRDRDMPVHWTTMHAGVPVPALVTTLAHLPDDVSIVLDDVDEIREPDALAMLDRFVEGASDRCIVLIGRARPRLPTVETRWLTDEIVNIDDSDLRFDRDETRRLLELQSNGAHAAELGEWADGWALALDRAGVALAAEPDDHQSRARRDLGDYLRTSVLDRLDPDDREFMLLTSVPHSLTARSCEELSGRADALAAMHELDQRGLFVTRVAGSTNTYAYPELVRSLLEEELARVEPGARQKLHRLAAERAHHENSEFVVDHWIAAEELDTAWRTFEQRFVDTLFRGHRGAVERWVDALVTNTRAATPRQSLSLAIAYAYLGRTHDARVCLAAVDAAEPVADPWFTAYRMFASFVLAYVDSETVPAARGAAECRNAFEAAGIAEHWLGLRGPLFRAVILTRLGRYERAREVLDGFERVFADARTGDRVAVSTMRANIDFEEGHLPSAMVRASRAIELEQGAEGSYPCVALAYHLRGCMRAEHNDLAGATADLQLAAQRDQGLAWMFVVPRLALARLLESTGDGARAWELVAEARTQIAPAAIVLNQRVLETETLLAIEAGELDRAEASVEQLLEPCRSRMNARVALARGDVATARTAIDNVTATTARDRIDTLLTRAQCAASPEETTVLVRAALEIGEPEGFLRTFSMERGWIRPTLVQLIGEWPTGYVSEVVDAIDHEPANPAMLFAELTPRELQVLRYLATSFSMLEVAGALSISRNTLKTHARAIYRKLRVPGRHEAVALLRRTTRGSSPQ